MPAGPREPVERHNVRVYWPNRDVAVVLVDFFYTPGRIFRYTDFSGGRGVLPAFTYAHFFRVAVAVAIYCHKLFGLPSAAQFAF